MNSSSTGHLPEIAQGAERLLSVLPFGICLMDATECILWANAILCEQLGVRSEQLPGRTFDELPLQSCQIMDGVYSPEHRPNVRLRLVTTPLSEDTKLVVFTDVTDLASNAQGNIEVLRELARTDPDTGLLTASAVYRELLTEVARSRRYGNMLTIIRIAAAYQGSSDKRNEFTNVIGLKLSDNVRAIDYVGVLEGGDFLIVLTETDVRGAQRFADKMKSMLESEPVSTEFGGAANHSVRFGIAQWGPSDDVSTLLNRCGERLAA
ncbi:MAG: diguanylate cyclase [Gammaproteobacteria bacterium]|nr:diguanylate cyclase [Gammaproteobacteria bacterium]MDH3467809.1 diguanylate cyclase [Gammaproteobacteria bacterium]